MCESESALAPSVTLEKQCISPILPSINKSNKLLLLLLILLTASTLILIYKSWLYTYTAGYTSTPVARFQTGPVTVSYQFISFVTFIMNLVIVGKISALHGAIL